MKLNVKKIAAWKGPGLLSDGRNLYLTSDGSKRKSWVFIFKSPATGKQRTMGLGSVVDVSLATAREMATEARAHLRRGVDPIEERRDEAARRSAAQRRTPTFGAFADQYIATKSAGWKNAKHRDQWKMTLSVLVAPLRSKPLDQIGTEDVLEVLKPQWERVPETARRLRARIENVLDAAKAAGHRSGENPAAWRGHLAHLLPRRRRLVHGHFRALPWRQVPEFMAALRARGDVGALLLEFCILTATRSGEARGAVWSEFDFDQQVWTIPGARMKTARPHTVPLSDRVLEILRTMSALRGDSCQLAFPSRANRPYSDMSMTKTIRAMGYAKAATCHGFRSSFKDWANEATSYANELSERALAHVISNQAEAAYSRSDLLAKRREMMQAWARHCAGGSNVVQMVTAA